MNVVVNKFGNQKYAKAADHEDDAGKGNTMSGTAEHVAKPRFSVLY